MTDRSHARERIPVVGTIAPGSREERTLEESWETKPGFIGWLGSVDHKEVGKRYLVTAFLFLLVGGVEALILRVQLARPNETLLTPEQYNQLFTMHGVTMIFLYALPILSGFSNFLWPLLLGSRDMAFPRLNALSYWVFLFSGVFLYASFPLGQAPNAGWFNYVPYASLTYNPGPNIDVYALGMVFLGLSTTVGSINFIVSLFRTRAPGMSINRVPILVWGTLTASVGNLLAVPAVSLAFLLLWFDRQFGTHFFDFTAGGKPLLWQHLFWMFGHPWVYAIVLPAMGIVSDGLPTFCRRPLVGYTAVALSTDRDDDPRLRRVGASHVRDRPAAAVAVVLRLGELRHRDPERGRGVRVDRDDLVRTAGRARRRSCSSRASCSCSSSAACPAS